MNPPCSSSLPSGPSAEDSRHALRPEICLQFQLTCESDGKLKDASKVAVLAHVMRSKHHTPTFFNRCSPHVQVEQCLTLIGGGRKSHHSHMELPDGCSSNFIDACSESYQPPLEWGDRKVGLGRHDHILEDLHIDKKHDDGHCEENKEDSDYMIPLAAAKLGPLPRATRGRSASTGTSSSPADLKRPSHSAGCNVRRRRQSSLVRAVVTNLATDGQGAKVENVKSDLSRPQQKRGRHRLGHRASDEPQRRSSDASAQERHRLGHRASEKPRSDSDIMGQREHMAPCATRSARWCPRAGERATSAARVRNGSSPPRGNLRPRDGLSMSEHGGARRHSRRSHYVHRAEVARPSLERAGSFGELISHQPKSRRQSRRTQHDADEEAKSDPALVAASNLKEEIAALRSQVQAHEKAEEGLMMEVTVLRDSLAARRKVLAGGRGAGSRIFVGSSAVEARIMSGAVQSMRASFH